MYRLYTFIFSGILCTCALAAQETGPALALADPADPPSLLAYRSASTTGESVAERFTLRRERTLLGDLDLSGAWGGPTYNYSATGNDWALVRGGFGGLEFGEDVFIGYGGWKAREPFTTDDELVGSPGPEYNFRHGGFILAYSPGTDNIIHPRFTAIIGPGRIDYAGNTERDRMLIGQLMGGAEINLFQWFRIGLEGGYRFASGVDTGDAGITASDVSGAVLQIEARFGWSW
jgi:hypothetical protein